MVQIGVINEQAFVEDADNYNFKKLNENDQKIYSEAIKQQNNDHIINEKK